MKMTRDQKLKEVQKIERDIKDLKDFLQVLEYENTVHKNNRWTKAMFKRTTEFSFLGVFNGSRNVEIKIPEYLTIEIAAKTIRWIEQLEKRADSILKQE